MAPTEHSILSTFLLNPASLQTFMTLEQFTALFPRTQRGNPQIKFLYRELQYQRALVTDQVKKEITAEIKRGQKLQREVARARRKAEQDNFGLDPNDGREIDMEIEVCCDITDEAYGSDFVSCSCLAKLPISPPINLTRCRVSCQKWQRPMQTWKPRLLRWKPKPNLP